MILICVIAYLGIMTLSFIIINCVIGGYFEDEWQSYANIVTKGYDCEKLRDK